MPFQSSNFVIMIFIFITFKSAVFAQRLAKFVILSPVNVFVHRTPKAKCVNRAHRMRGIITHTAVVNCANAMASERIHSCVINGRK